MLRIAPLAVWCSALSKPQAVLQAMKSEVELTHTNELVRDATYLYSIAIIYLL